MRNQEDLLNAVEFEYDEEMNLIIDNMWEDPHYPNHYLVQIQDRYFLVPFLSIAKNGESTAQTFKPLNESIAALYVKNTNKQKAPDYICRMLKCVPRNGFIVTPKRSITSDELNELREQYSITEDNISNPFYDKKGEFYGEKYAKQYRCVQIRTEKGTEAIEIEQNLLEMGIQAANKSPNRVNIRISDN